MNKKCVISGVTTTVIIIAIILLATLVGYKNSENPIEPTNSTNLTNSTDNVSAANADKFTKPNHVSFAGAPDFVRANVIRSNGNGNVLPKPGDCGSGPLTERIIGGRKLDLDEHPWVVLLEYRFPDNSEDYQCGGTLINQRYVITAAHCLIPKDAVGVKLLTVRLGETNLITDIDCVKDAPDDCAPPPIDIGIEDVIPHPYYKHDKQYDIGLIRLAQDVEFSDFIKPICLPTPAIIVEDGFSLITAGWGNTHATKGEPSATKLGVSLPLFNFDKCRQQFATQKIEITDSQLCAGGEANKDSCQNDSGGPLMFSKSSVWYLMGIVSFGHSCGVVGWPGVYTNVTYYNEWIRDNLSP